MSAGCSDNKPEDTVTPEENAPAVSMTEDLVQKAETATEQATEKLNEATRKAQAAADDLNKKAQSAIETLTVSKNEVLAEINQPIEDLKAKVEALAQPELLAYANTYKDVLLEKKDQLAGLADQLKGLPMAAMLGEKGKAIKDQVSQYTAQFNQLKERYRVYLDKLKSLGVDLSAFGI